MFFGSFWSGIKLLEIDPRTGLAAEAAKLISVAARPREKAIEAPCVVSRGGYYYLFVSFDQACKGADSTYKIMVGRSRDLSGPYLDRRGGPMLKGGGTLVLAGQGRWRGPGHNAVLRDKTGDWLVHHAYDAQNDGAATLRIRPLLWASDGWPLAGECGVPAAGTGGAVRAEDVAGSWECSTDFGEPRRVVLQPGGRVEGIDGGASWSLSGRRLLIRRRDPQAPGGARTDECLLGPGGAWYVGRDEGGAVLQGRKAAPS